MGGILLHLVTYPGRAETRATLETYDEIGDQNAWSLAKNGLGYLFQAMVR